MSKTLWTTLVAGEVFWATILATPATAAGAFCEGDGECGTDDDLNNCSGTDWYFRTD